jgi:glutaredoxin
MLKNLKVIAMVLFVACGACFAKTANASSDINKTVTIFYSPTCPHCHHLMDFVKKDLLKKYPNVRFNMKDTTKNGTKAIWDIFKRSAGLPLSQNGVPQTYVEGELVLGFGTPQTTGQQIIKLIEKE